MRNLVLLRPNKDGRSFRLLRMFSRLARRHQAFTTAAGGNLGHDEAAFLRVGLDFRRLIQKAGPGAKYFLFKQPRFDGALDAPRLDQPAVEDRVAALHNIEFPIG